MRPIGQEFKETLAASAKKFLQSLAAQIVGTIIGYFLTLWMVYEVSFSYPIDQFEGHQKFLFEHGKGAPVLCPFYKVLS